MGPTEKDTRDAAAIKRDIDRTRASMNRKADDLRKRIEDAAARSAFPAPRRASQWIALGAVAAGTCLALAVRRSRPELRPGHR